MSKRARKAVNASLSKSSKKHASRNDGAPQPTTTSIHDPAPKLYEFDNEPTLLRRVFDLKDVFRNCIVSRLNLKDTYALGSASKTMQTRLHETLGAYREIITTFPRDPKQCMILAARRGLATETMHFLGVLARIGNGSVPISRAIREAARGGRAELVKKLLGTHSEMEKIAELAGTPLSKSQSARALLRALLEGMHERCVSMAERTLILGPAADTMVSGIDDLDSFQDGMELLVLAGLHTRTSVLITKFAATEATRAQAYEKCIDIALMYDLPAAFVYFTDMRTLLPPGTTHYVELFAESLVRRAWRDRALHVMRYLIAEPRCAKRVDWEVEWNKALTSLATYSEEQASRQPIYTWNKHETGALTKSVKIFKLLSKTAFAAFSARRLANPYAVPIPPPPVLMNTGTFTCNTANGTFDVGHWIHYAYKHADNEELKRIAADPIQSIFGQFYGNTLDLRTFLRARPPRSPDL